MIHPRNALLSMALGLTLISVSGCGKSSEQPGAGESAAASSAPDAKPGIAVTDGKLVLPAVLGNPGAAYFKLTNSGSAPSTIAKIDIDGANMAEMHMTTATSMTPLVEVEVKPGETVSFEPGGKHVMAFKLNPDLAPGSTAEMTITFLDGDKLSVPLAVEAPGGGGAMDHGKMP